MKKFVNTLFAMSLSTVLVACGGDNNTEELQTVYQEETAVSEEEKTLSQTSGNIHTFKNISFTLNEDWEIGNENSGALAISTDKPETLLIISEPLTIISNDLSDLSSTPEAFMFRNTLSDSLNAQNLDVFTVSTGEVSKYPTLGATFGTMVNNTPFVGSSMMLFGNEQYVMVYTLFLPENDYFIDDFISFVQTIEFID